MASTYLQRTQTAGNQKTFTISSWLKRSGNFANYNHLFTNSPNPGTWDSVRFDNDDQLAVRINNDSYVIKTNRKFRDASGWYHIVIAVDTTQGTSSNRVKIYVNGTQETSLASSSYPTQNLDTNFNKNSQIIRIGQNSWSSGNQTFDGSMSYAALVDGTQELPTIFGETDSVTGQWKIKTGITPSSGWGNNGFLILKNSNSVTDQSGQGNNFTVGSGTLTKTEDNPSNVFCTFNKLYNTNANGDLIPVLTSGNTILLGHGGSYWYQIPGTLAFTSGKFYWECKFNSGTNLDKNTPGVIDYEKCFGTGQFQDQTGSVFYKNEDGGETRLDGSTSSANYGTLTQNQILGVAVDMDAGTPTVKFYRNGSLLATVNASSLAGKFVTPAQMVYGSGQFQLNFGNGYFGTTAVSSAGTNASGNGIFEYDVPSGYTALSTKGLNL